MPASVSATRRPTRSIAAGAPLLILLGHLRLMPAEIEPASLATHIAETIEEFERRIADAGVTSEDARIAKFVLCETADDIVGNVPGTRQGRLDPDRHAVAVLPGGNCRRRVFKALNKILAEPENHRDLLELMHACLLLGFEGQYRGLARDDGSLQRVRQDVYETLRYFTPRADDEISPRWQGMSEAMRNASPRMPSGSSRRPRLPWWSVHFSRCGSSSAARATASPTN